MTLFNVKLWYGFSSWYTTIFYLTWKYEFYRTKNLIKYISKNLHLIFTYLICPQIKHVKNFGSTKKDHKNVGLKADVNGWQIDRLINELAWKKSTVNDGKARKVPTEYKNCAPDPNNLYVNQLQIALKYTKLQAQRNF